MNCCCNDFAKLPIKVCVAFDANGQSNEGSTNDQPNGESIKKELETLKKEIDSNKKGMEALKKEMEKPKKDTSPFLCEFYYFRNPLVRKGFEPAQGGIISKADALYPEAWEYLQSSEGKKLCVTEKDWQALTKATWATLADGTKVGFNGIGGAPFYVQDVAAGTLRLPDLRGMYPEAAGFDGLKVGNVHGDMIRNIEGEYNCSNNVKDKGQVSILYANALLKGAFVRGGATSWLGIPGQNYDKSNNDGYAWLMDISRVVPTGNANKPRAWGANACVYLGTPNTNS